MKITIKLNTKNIKQLEKAASTSAVETMEAVHDEINDTVPLDQGGLQNSIFVSDESNEKVIHVKLEHSMEYARYLYHGLKMVDKYTGKGPALIPKVGYRFRRGTKLKVKKPEEKLRFRYGRADHWLEPYIGGEKKEFVQTEFTRAFKEKTGL